MFLRSLRRAAFLCCSLSVVHACGARTGLRPGKVTESEGGAGGEAPDSGGQDASPPKPECQMAEDCPNQDRCVQMACLEGSCIELSMVACDDGDPCSKDSCDPATGSCEHESPIDGDGDGFEGITADFAGCGDDCDDDDPLVNPLAPELCDGRDNDCNGVIDDGTLVNYGGFEPVRVSGLEFDRAMRGGISLSDTTLGLTYSGHTNAGWRGYFTQIDANGTPLGELKPITRVNADSYAGVLSWTGDYHATAWSDAHQAGNYEVYFNRLTKEGDKLAADLRLSDAPDFSVQATLLELEGGFLVAWSDFRVEPVQIYAIRLAADGSVLPEQSMTPAGEWSQYPALAVGESRIGFAHTVLQDGVLSSGRFSTLDLALQNPSTVTDLGSENVEELGIAAVEGGFVVSWHTASPAIGPSIMAASFNEDGSVRVGTTPITSGALHARSHSLVSLGDRVVMIWADDLDGYYQLYSQVLDVNLNVLRARERITFAPADTLSPAGVVLSDGGIGILFEDWRSGHQVYYTRLDCGGP